MLYMMTYMWYMMMYMRMYMIDDDVKMIMMFSRTDACTSYRN